MTDPKERTTQEMMEIYCNIILFLALVDKDLISTDAKERLNQAKNFSREQFIMYSDCWRKGGKK